MPPNDLLSLPAHFANLYLPVLWHNVPVEAYHGGCRRNAFRKTGLGIDHEYVGGLESRRIDIAGTCDDSLIIEVHLVHEETGIP